MYMLTYLPPAFRRNGEGNVFTGVCPSTHLRGGGGGGLVPPSGSHIYRPHSEGMGKVMFSQASVRPHTYGGGYPHLANQGGMYPLPKSGWGMPIPGQDGGTWGIPHQDGAPPFRSQVRMGGYPIPGQDRGYPLPAISKMGAPIQVQVTERGGLTPNWNNMACTCYTAGSMPLVFMQEDFVVQSFCLLDSNLNFSCLTSVIR